MTVSDGDLIWLQRALSLAKKAEQGGEVPVGAVIVKDNDCLAEAWNQPILTHDPTAHAEIVALRLAAKKLKNYRLVDCTVYVTLEPCLMCASAMVHARVKRLVFSALDPRQGAVTSVFQVLDNNALNHRVIWQQGALAEEAGGLLRQFFQARRYSGSLDC